MEFMAMSWGFDGNVVEVMGFQVVGFMEGDFGRLLV
jgi:hypothetical protein